MKLKSLKIEPWTTDPKRTYRDAVFMDEATGVTIGIPLSADDVLIIEAAMEDIVKRVLEVMKDG